MTTRGGSKRVYTLTSMSHLPTVVVPYPDCDPVIETRDINKVLRVPRSMSGSCFREINSVKRR